MYLPQLTTGASSACWMPDSKGLVYSMAGSLWRQNFDSNEATELTSGPGYDYQPDCSRDGRWVIYTSYFHDAMELWALDLSSGHAHALTSAGAVNLEPRLSPDGKRIGYVSTLATGHFHIFVANFADGQLANARALLPENKSASPRPYYSPFDHEISPAWLSDGSEIFFISNRGHVYGTGGIWQMKAEPGSEPREIHSEETTWKARPDVSPEGKRLVFASYLGQEWHQLWVMPAKGGDAFPISYGDFDNINPRWSPDGKKIAFISNRDGNTSLWVEDFPGGHQTEVQADTRHYRRQMGKLEFSIYDASGQLTPARVFITGADDRAYAANETWMQADDSFVRTERPFEAHYSVINGIAEVVVPAGDVRVEVMKGFEYQLFRKTVSVPEGQSVPLKIHLTPLTLPADSPWVSGDLHVHMNYGGTYRNAPVHLVLQAAAENLGVTENLIVNKEQRIPDINYFQPGVDSASSDTNLVLHGQEFHTGYWGHLGLLNLTQNFILPDYAAYPNTAAASPYPSNADIADLAHAQGGIVGYVHPDDRLPDTAASAQLTYELPVDVALGKVDYLEVVAFSDHGDTKVAAGDHKSTAELWYRLLNCGFHLPAAAGTDAMENFASLRGPIGLNRVYAHQAEGPLDITAWLNALKKGRTFATNGPLLGFTLQGSDVGDELKLAAGDYQLHFRAWLRSFVPVDHLQVVCNGEVVKDLPLQDHQSADIEGTVSVSRSGWCLLRAFSDKPEFPVFDAYPYATTSPVYVTVEGSALLTADAAAYFVKWIDRMIQAATSNPNWNTEEEKKSVLATLSRARTIYVQLEK
jgi:Tol biopolymer transport system component